MNTYTFKQEDLQNSVETNDTTSLPLSFAAVVDAETLSAPTTAAAGKTLASCQQSKKNEDSHY